MNPRAARFAIVIVAIGGAAFVAGFVVLALFAGCSRALPPEPSYVETVTKVARDR